MKSPTNINGNNLVTWLQSATEIRMADLYTITLKSGAILRYTTWDANLVVLGNTFLTGPPHIRRSHIEEKLGLDVSSLDLEIAAIITDTINGVPVLQLIANGTFDGATLRIDRLFMDATGNQIGTVVRFSGMIGELDEVTRTSAKLTVNALVHLLGQPLPNIILQPNCTNTLFDARCGLVKASFANALTVQAGSTVNKLISLSAQPDGYFDNGQLVFTSGASNGITKAVKSYFGQQFFFNSPLPFAPSAGDTFTAYPGCDKTQATCASAKFNNLANFEGFPYVPVPETAI
jgi:uncharacterized phage protein (TIGR02218 family)